MSRIFVAGYPGDVGGANTELWHTIKLWRERKLDVTLIPTWGRDDKWEKKLDDVGCVTSHVKPENLADSGLRSGDIVVSFCNGEFVKSIDAFRDLGAKIVWVNCMTFAFPHELDAFENRPPDCLVFQSEFQRHRLLESVPKWEKAPGVLVRSAVALDELPFAPRAHENNTEFFIGRCARSDTDKWSSNLLTIYDKIAYPSKRAILMGVDDRVRKKLGQIPWWCDLLKANAIPVKTFYSRLHCCLPVNGGARENWPRVGLECMAAGVPIVAENSWGWREMIDHGVTGQLGSSDDELAHFAAVLAHSEQTRVKMTMQARDRLYYDLACPDKIWSKWEEVFSLCSPR